MKRKAPMKRRPGKDKKADDAFSLLIRRRDGGCVAGGTDSTRCNGRLQCAHIVSRRYHAIRWDEANAVALCGAHHLRYTRNPDGWRHWLAEQGHDWDALWWLAQNDPPEKPADALARLKEMA